METQGAREPLATVGKKRVVFWSRYAYPVLCPGAPGMIGGAEIKTVGYARQLSRRSLFEVAVVIEAPPGAKELSEPGLDVIPMKGRHQSLLGKFRPLRVLLDRLSILACFRRARPDVIIESAAGPETLDMVLASRLLGAKAIYWAASMGDFDGRCIRDLGRIRAATYALSLAFIDRIICQTEEQRRQLRAWKGVEGVLLRNGVELAERPDIPGTDLGWAGKWHRWKGPERYLSLARAHPQFRFRMLVSTGDNPRVREDIVEMTQDLRNIDLHFDVPVVEVLDHFRKCRLHVNTSTQEGFPNSILQAASLGVPTLSFEVDPDGLLGSGVLGACAGADEAMMSTLLCRFMQDNPFWREASNRAQGHVRTYHSLEKNTETLEEVITETLAEPSPKM